jgi:hypothetical protein
MSWIGPGTAAGQFLEWGGSGVAGTVWQPTSAIIGSTTINVQAVLGRVRFRSIQGVNGGNGIQVPTASWTIVGSITSQAMSWASAWLSVSKALIVSSAAANSAASWVGVSTSDFALSSTTAWAGGFLFVARCGVHTPQANGRSFYGMQSTTVASLATDPSAFVNCVGFGNDSADANMQIMQNDAAGTCTKTDLGASFPAQSSQADFYEMVLYAAPGQTSKVSYSILNLISGAFASGDLTSNLPAANTGLVQKVMLGNGSTAATCTIGMSSIHCQSGW